MATLSRIRVIDSVLKDRDIGIAGCMEEQGFSSDVYLEWDAVAPFATE